MSWSCDEVHLFLAWLSFGSWKTCVSDWLSVVNPLEDCEFYHSLVSDALVLWSPEGRLQVLTLTSDALTRGKTASVNTQVRSTGALVTRGKTVSVNTVRCIGTLVTRATAPISRGELGLRPVSPDPLLKYHLCGNC